MPTTTVAAIERQLDFRASPERLWRALTDDGELGAWFGQRRPARPAGGWRWLVRVRGPRPGPRPDRGLRPRDAASRGAGATSASPSTTGRRWSSSGWSRWPAAGRGSTSGSPGSPARTPAWSNTEGWMTELAQLAHHVAARAVRGGHPPDVRADLAARPRLAGAERPRGACAPGGPDRPTSRSGRASPAGSCGPARAAGSGCGSRPSSRRATCAGPGRPCPRCPWRSPRPVLRTEWTLVPRRRRRDRPPPVRERLHGAERLRHEQRRLGRRRAAGAAQAPRRGLIAARPIIRARPTRATAIGRAHPRLRFGPALGDRC